MSDTSLHITLVTPEQLYLETEVDMAVLPASLGEVGIMRDHAPFVSSLKPGVIRLHESADSSTHVFVSGGYVETHGERCTVLAEELLAIDTLDKAGLEQELEELTQAIAQRGAEDVDSYMLEKHAVIQAKLEAIAQA